MFGFSSTISCFTANLEKERPDKIKASTEGTDGFKP